MCRTVGVDCSRSVLLNVSLESEILWQVEFLKEALLLKQSDLTGRRRLIVMKIAVNSAVGVHK